MSARMQYYLLNLGGFGDIPKPAALDYLISSVKHEIIMENHPELLHNKFFSMSIICSL